MARICPSRLRILTTGVNILIDFTKKQIFENCENRLINVDFPAGGVFGKYKREGNFENPESPNLAMLRGIRMARICPSRLRILIAGVEKNIELPKNNKKQK